MTFHTIPRTKEPVLAWSHLPASVANAFGNLARWLDRRSGARLPLLLLGILFASQRRTVTSWFHGAGISATSTNSLTNGNLVTSSGTAPGGAIDKSVGNGNGSVPGAGDGINSSSIVPALLASTVKGKKTTTVFDDAFSVP